MKHTFNLVKPKAQVSPIRLIVSHNGEKFQRSIGVSINTSLWNRKAKSLEKTCKDANVWSVIGPIHARLVEKEITVHRRKEVLDAISYALGEETCIKIQGVHLWDYFKEWSDRDTPSRRFRQLAYNRIAAIMGTDDDWEDIDGDWYFRFIQKCDANKYSHNYKSTLTAKLKTVMNEGLSRGIHSNTQFKGFCTSFKTADTIALTQAEVNKLWEAELQGVQARARDCFIVGVYCAGRFQDYSQLSKNNLSGGKLQYVQRKTGQTVIIPCSSRIKEVFDRNGGRVPKVTEQEVSREIKKICKEIGGSFKSYVEITKSKGNKTIIERHHRYDLITTHTARRTGASILYKSGVPIRVCRLLTGHTTDSMFLNYVKISKEEGAEILAKSKFFK